MNEPLVKSRLNTIEAANFLGVAHESLKRSRWSARLWGRAAPKFIKEGSGNVRYLRSTLEQWLKLSQEYQSTADYSRRKSSESVTAAD